MGNFGPGVFCVHFTNPFRFTASRMLVVRLEKEPWSNLNEISVEKCSGNERKEKI